MSQALQYLEYDFKKILKEFKRVCVPMAYVTFMYAVAYSDCLRNSHATAQLLKTTNSGKLFNSKAISARRFTTFLCKEASRRKLSSVTVSNRSDTDIRSSVERLFLLFSFLISTVLHFIPFAFVAVLIEV